MPVIDQNAIPEVLMRAGVSGKFIVSKDTGSHGLTMLINIVQPGASIPLHRHTAEESGLVIEGEIWARIGDQQYIVTPHEVVVFPPTVPHAWGNAGPDVARVVWTWNSNAPFSDSVYLEGLPPKDSP